MAYSDKLRVDVALKLQGVVEDITEGMAFLKDGNVYAAGSLANALTKLRAAERAAHEWADHVDEERK